MTRILTYNVHRCLGTDGRLDVGRVAAVIAEAQPDIVGDAILTCLPERVIKTGPLPGYKPIPQLEPRGALMVAIEVAPGVEVQVINTHLGLVPREQQIQAAAVAGDGWLGHEDRRDPLILIGDFNATRRSVVWRTLSAKLTDATQGRSGPRIATFPARAPLLRIDHVFVSQGVRVTGLHVPATPLAKVASDHRPLVMDFEVDV
jgi:endonuclease/exonuclease/phosphatase family metal-dependent hydrolase